MRIISKGRDYYDVIQKYGFDDDIIYIRNERQIFPDKYHNDIYVQKYIIGFAGKLYPLIYYTGGHNKYDIPNDVKFIAYNIDELDAGINDLFNNTEKKYYFDRSWKYYSFNSHRRASYLDFFTGAVSRENTLFGRDVFREFNVPIFLARVESHYDYKLKGPVYKAVELIVDCALEPWEFYRIKDSYSAFFELRDYIGGVLLGNNRPIPAVSNDDLIVAKGFDLKTSFRKEKEKK